MGQDELLDKTSPKNSDNEKTVKAASKMLAALFNLPEDTLLTTK